MFRTSPRSRALAAHIGVALESAFVPISYIYPTATFSSCTFFRASARAAAIKPVKSSRFSLPRLMPATDRGPRRTLFLLPGGRPRRLPDFVPTFFDLEPWLLMWRARCAGMENLRPHFLQVSFFAIVCAFRIRRPFFLCGQCNHIIERMHLGEIEKEDSAPRVLEDPLRRPPGNNHCLSFNVNPTILLDWWTHSRPQNKQGRKYGRGKCVPPPWHRFLS